MPEAAILILDNSDFSINGDYQPTRWLNQIDAAGLLIQTKLEQHHENSMGIALSAGKQVEVICTPSNDITKVTSFLYGVKQHGHIKLSVALQTSALALKHRSNPNLLQRIVCFIASTITDSIQQLKLVCKKLKKNGIALDLIALGDLSQKQRQILQAMHDNVRSQSNCDLVFVQPKSNLSDILFTSKILGAEPQQQHVINEAQDPELMMALQLSLQEEQQRVAAMQGRNDVSNPAAAQQSELQEQALQLAMDEQKGDEKEGKKQDKREQ